MMSFCFWVSSLLAHELTPAFNEGKGDAADLKAQMDEALPMRDVSTFIELTQGRGGEPSRKDVKPRDINTPITDWMGGVFNERMHVSIDMSNDPLFQPRGEGLGAVDGQLVHRAHPQQYTYHTCRETKLKPLVECHVYKHMRIRTYFQDVIKSSYIDTNQRNKLYSIKKLWSEDEDRPRFYRKQNPDRVKLFILSQTKLEADDITRFWLQSKLHRKGKWKDARQSFTSYGWGALNASSQRLFRVNYSYKTQVKKNKAFAIEDNQCQAIEDQVGRGLYTLASKTCLDALNPREVEGVIHSEPCWHEIRIYHASKRSGGNCEELKRRGCEQIDSRPSHPTQPQVLEQTFRCPVTVDTNKATHLPGKRPFCLTGDCEHIQDQNDDGFEQAMAQIAILNELQKYAGEPELFKGKSLSCASTKFKKCCFKSSGLAVKTGFSRCSSGEKELGKRRGKGHCVYVGKQSVKKLGVKVGYKKVYCCYPSKLLRVFQEQGHKQLRLGWGGAKHPKCRGLRLQEIQHLDFGRMDLSEAFAEIQASIKRINVQDVPGKLKQRLRQMQEGIQ